jgi:hypothetical protein
MSRVLLCAFALTVTAWQPGQPAAAVTLPTMVDREIAAIEKPFVDAAEAMPAAKFDFSPEGLRIPGADYKGVRTFAQEVKHVAASNYALWSSLTGERAGDKFNDGKGPDAVKTKADILVFLEDSFALGHRAAATLTPANMLQPPAGSDSARLQRAMFAVSHAYDHYGQIVEYLRMNGIVPPASR